MSGSITQGARVAAVRGYHRARAWGIARRDRIPRPVRLAVRRAERSLDPVAISMYRRRTGETRPIPPRGMRERNSVDRLEWWIESVERSERILHDLLASVDRRVEDFDRALDFGCGAGRVICSLRGRGPELHGCDIHEPSIRWLARNYPDLNFMVNPFDPPLAYPDGHFDLMWAWSVLTHIDSDRQAAWIREWARIVQPGGLVLATFNSPGQVENWKVKDRYLPEGVDAELEREGVAFVPGSTEGNFAADFAGTSLPYGDTFNTSENVTAHFRESGFEVVDVAERAFWGTQDCVIARRLDGG